MKSWFFVTWYGLIGFSYEDVRNVGVKSLEFNLWLGREWPNHLPPLDFRLYIFILYPPGF